MLLGEPLLKVIIGQLDNPFWIFIALFYHEKNGAPISIYSFNVAHNNQELDPYLSSDASYSLIVMR